MKTKEYKRRKSIIWLILIVVLVYTPCALLQINVLYDFSEGEQHTTVLIDKHIDDDGVLYYFTVQMIDDEEREVGVMKEFYDMRSVGDTVTLVENRGLLGISYVYIDEE